MGKFDWQKKEVEAFPVYGLKDFVNREFRFVQTEDNRLFISGGMGSFKDLREVVEVEDKLINLITHKDMRNGRRSHTLNVLGDKYLIATGGRDETGKYLNSCELYEIATMEWFDLPPLIIARQKHTGCVVSAQSLYVFCGIKETTLWGL